MLSLDYILLCTRHLCSHPTSCSMLLPLSQFHLRNVRASLLQPFWFCLSPWDYPSKILTMSVLNDLLWPSDEATANSFGSRPTLSFPYPLPSSEVSMCLTAKPIGVKAGWGFASPLKVCHKWKVPKAENRPPAANVQEYPNLSRHTLTGESQMKNRNLRRERYEEIVPLTSSVIFSQCL